MGFYELDVRDKLAVPLLRNVINETKGGAFAPEVVYIKQHNSINFLEVLHEFSTHVFLTNKTSFGDVVIVGEVGLRLLKESPFQRCEICGSHFNNTVSSLFCYIDCCLAVYSSFLLEKDEFIVFSSDECVNSVYSSMAYGKIIEW